MTDLTALRTLPPLAARYIAEHGWTQGVEENNQGEVCLTGALRLCAPVPGDGTIARAVFRHRGHAEQWNDFDGRTQGEVVGYLANAEITDGDLADTFGPQWLEVAGIIRQVASATDEQIDALVMARTTAARPAREAAWGAASNAARGAAQDAARGAAWGAAGDAAGDATRGAASNAARGALLATVTRDLIGTEGYTQEHYDQLMAPWRAVFGEVKP